MDRQRVCFSVAVFVPDESRHPLVVVTWSDVVSVDDIARFGAWRHGLLSAAQRAGRPLAFVHDTLAVASMDNDARKDLAVFAGDGFHVGVWIVAASPVVSGAIAAVRWWKPATRVFVVDARADAEREARRRPRRLARLRPPQKRNFGRNASEHRRFSGVPNRRIAPAPP